MLTSLSAPALREVIEAIGAPVFVVSVDPDGDAFRFMAVNRCLEDLAAVRGDVLAGAEPHAVLPTDLADRLVARLRQCRAAAAPMAYDGHLTRHGETRLVRVTLAPLVDAAGVVRAIMGTPLDVTDQRRAEQRLHAAVAEERALFRDLAQLSSDWFWMTDGRGRLVPFKPDTGEADADAGLGDPSATAPASDEGRDGEPLRCGGAATVVDLATAGLSFRDLLDTRLPEEDLPALEAAMADRRAFRGLVYPQRLRDGRARVVRVSGNPRWTADGTFAGYRGVCTDITEGRNWLRGQIDRQRRESLGQLAGGLAHELNNLLLPVLALSRRLRRRLPPDGADAAMVQDIHDAASHARDVVRSVMAFSGQGATERRPIMIADVIGRAVDLAAGMLPPNVAVVRSIEPLAETAAVRSADVAQVVVNLMSNAADALAAGGGGTIRVGFGLAADGRGARAVLRVQDDGPGMDAATRDSAFDPFFTTKGVGDGSGLGLSVVYGLVKGWGGEVTVATAPGEGAVFDVVIPLMVDDAEAGAGMHSGTRDVAG